MVEAGKGEGGREANLNICLAGCLCFVRSFDDYEYVDDLAELATERGLDDLISDILSVCTLPSPLIVVRWFLIRVRLLHRRSEFFTSSLCPKSSFACTYVSTSATRSVSRISFSRGGLEGTLNMMSRLKRYA